MSRNMRKIDEKTYIITSNDFLRTRSLREIFTGFLMDDKGRIPGISLYVSGEWPRLATSYRTKRIYKLHNMYISVECFKEIFHRMISIEYLGYLRLPFKYISIVVFFESCVGKNLKNQRHFWIMIITTMGYFPVTFDDLRNHEYTLKNSRNQLVNISFPNFLWRLGDK